MLYLFGKKLGTQHYPTVAGVGYTTPTYEIMDVGCWVHNNQLYKSWLLGTQQPTNFRRCVVLCWFLLVRPMSVRTPSHVVNCNCFCVFNAISAATARNKDRTFLCVMR